MVWLMFCLLACVSGVCSAANPALPESASADKNIVTDIYDPKVSLAISQSVVGSRLGEYHFYDARGRSVKMSDYIGKPLVISLVYTSCYQVCSMTTRNLARAVKKARDALGKDGFHVLTIGFDTPVDTADAMAHFARQQGVDENGWDFLSTDAQTMSRLIKDTGFSYFATPKGFDHMIQATVVDSEGVVRVQVYGEMINTPQMVEPLMQLVFGKAPKDTPVDGLIKRVRLFCTVYDPASDSYRFDYSLFIGMFIGGSIILITAFFLVRDLRRNRSG
jgi:protein SCO1/2